MKSLLFLLIALVSNMVVQAQPLLQPGNTMPAGKEHLLLLNKAKYPEAPAHKGGTAKITSGSGMVFDTTRWAHIIDSTWGAGLRDTDKLTLFNEFWVQVDSYYACFVGLPPYNWDSITNAMRAEIRDSVSRGRFAGIISNLLGYINDVHTSFYDYVVNYGTPIYPGLPVFRGESGKFGACITAVNDSVAMVYTADIGHPFGLQPGDVIVGYNGIPWTNLIQLLQLYQLPSAQETGSSPEATYHRLVQSAGENWYLFDTINIRKCNGALVSFPTSLMIGTHYQDMCTDEMQVPGVHKLTYTDYASANRIVCAGVITGTRIGYVSMIDCEDATGDSLLNAVKILVEDSLVEGLIFDIRTNYGGGFNAYISTFNYLNAGDVSWVGYGDRLDPTNRLLMYNYPSSMYDLADSDPNSFNSKVAILTGPNAVSAGDFFPVLFRHNPYVKTFGKSTGGAYGARVNIPISYANYYASRQEVNFYDVANPSHYLSHTAVPVDSNIWYSQTSVCAGTDTILNTAVKWIEGDRTGVANTAKLKPGVRLYPNPSTGKFSLVINSPVSETISIKVCNVLGATLTTVKANLNAGEQVVKMDFSDMHLAGGSYYLMLQGSGFGSMVKKITIIN